MRWRRFGELWIGFLNMVSSGLWSDCTITFFQKCTDQISHMHKLWRVALFQPEHSFLQFELSHESCKPLDATLVTELRQVHFGKHRIE